MTDPTLSHESARIRAKAQIHSTRGLGCSLGPTDVEKEALSSPLVPSLDGLANSKQRRLIRVHRKSLNSKCNTSMLLVHGIYSKPEHKARCLTGSSDSASCISALSRRDRRKNLAAWWGLCPRTSLGSAV